MDLSAALFRNTNPGWSLHSTGYVAPLNRWTHIVVVYDNGVVRTYANGALVDTYNGSGSISNAAALNIGQCAGLGRATSRGLIDEVRLFDRALRRAEVKALYVGSGPLLVLPFETQLGDGRRGWNGRFRLGARTPFCTPAVGTPRTRR